jgi:hypothetical protein
VCHTHKWRAIQDKVNTYFQLLAIKDWFHSVATYSDREPSDDDLSNANQKLDSLSIKQMAHVLWRWCLRERKLFVSFSMWCRVPLQVWNGSSVNVTARNYPSESRFTRRGRKQFETKGRMYKGKSSGASSYQRHAWKVVGRIRISHWILSCDTGLTFGVCEVCKKLGRIICQSVCVTQTLYGQFNFYDF